jgi:hypothetical protein
MRPLPLRRGAPLALLLWAAPVAGDVGAAQAWEVRLEVQREDGRAAGVFAPGEAVALVVVLRNPGDAPRSLSLATAQTHDFAVSGPDGRELWRWSAGRRFAQVLTELALAPGEEKRFRETCPAGVLAPGRYRAEAWLGTGAARLRAPPVDFRVD